MFQKVAGEPGAESTWTTMGLSATFGQENEMIRMIGYGLCVAAAVWLVVGSIQFRQTIRDDVNKAQARMYEFDPNSPGAHGKILNGYYEDVYRCLPHMILPALLVLGGSTVLLAVGRKKKTEPTAAASPTEAKQKVDGL